MIGSDGPMRNVDSTVQRRGLRNTEPKATDDPALGAMRFEAGINIRPHSLAARATAFQAVGRSSILRGATNMKTLIYTGIFAGSLMGGYLPLLWGGSVFSMTSVLLGGVGSLLGVWVGFKTAKRLGL